MRLRGYASLYIAASLFAFVSLFVKLASERYAGLFVSAARFAIGAALCLALLLPRGRGPGAGLAGSSGGAAPAFAGLRTKRLGLLILRGLFGSASMVLTYLAISLTGPGRAALLSNTYPLFVALFGALVFGEALRIRTLGSIAVCTAGAALVMGDGSGSSLAGDLVALASAVLAGVAVNIVRRLSQTESPFLIYLSPCLFGLPLLAFAPAPAPDALLDPLGLLLLLGVGVGAFLAQAFMARGYRNVQAGRGSIVFYWETGLTVALGLLFAGERFTPRFGAGLALILAGLWANRDREVGP
jgi:drug/metabolite transporter (DMT)-like permease